MSNALWTPRHLMGETDALPLVFPTTTMDPPWLERGGGGRGANTHYDLMDKRDILGTVLGSGVWRPADDAHLYMWVTNNFLRDGLWLMDALGFEYKTNLVWTKPRFGIGFYFRGRHELCLFGVRGQGAKVRTTRQDIDTHLAADFCRDGGRIVHSRKPVEFYELVQARSHGPYLEIFSRASHGWPGWASWGNEVGGGERREEGEEA